MGQAMAFPRISTFRTAADFRRRLEQLNLKLVVDEEVQSGTNSPLQQPVQSRTGRIGNRWCILPMEGWDGTADGKPSELTRRRWQNFGLSGAKLIWG
ncbi:MAG: NADH:flavin oxidoreductase, partial [Planctomycetaceae bacterium]|nr:NADH:flavin oxidoreductase [Planctomycetaceae bacterium]